MTRSGWKPHQGWLTLLAAAVILLLAGPPLADYALHQAERRSEEMATEQTTLQQQLQRFDEDRQLAGSAIDTDEIDHLMAPSNRLRIVAGLETQAATSHLLHFTYTLMPEKKIKTGADGLNESDLSLSADLRLDTDAYDFLQKTMASLPGRAHLRQLTLTRPNTGAPRTDMNLHMEATVQWLSNGAAKEMAGLP